MGLEADGIRWNIGKVARFLNIDKKTRDLMDDLACCPCSKIFHHFTTYVFKYVYVNDFLFLRIYF